MKLSEKIAELRRSKGWSQEQLAVKLEVSRQAVYKWEADINQPDLDKLKRISHLFNVSYDILMDDSIELPITPNLVETEKEEIPEVEILESKSKDTDGTGAVHNEVAVQINCAKETKHSNKRLVATLCVLAGVFVISLCVLSYILFGIVLQKDSYLVKFDTQGGTSVTDLVIKEGSVLDNLSAPTKKGYSFDGWYIGDKKWNVQEDKIKDNTTLIAKWIPNENKITYIDYETGNKIESSAKTDESVVLASNPFTRVGYAFKGWATAPNSEIKYANCDSFKMGTESISLYAVWELDEFTLTLNAGKGTINDTVPEKFTSNDKITLPVPTLEYYTFDGWYNENNTRVEFVAQGTTSNVSLTAKYIPVKYTITYELNGGTNNSKNNTKYDADNVAVFYAPERQDHSFLGWYLDRDFTTPISETALGKGGNITVYAKWELSSFSYELVTGGYRVIGYSGLNPIVEIPREYNGVPVIAIGEYAFKDLVITEVIIHQNITSIASTAFDGCVALKEITVNTLNSNFVSDNGILYNAYKTVLLKYPAGKLDTVYTAPNSLDVIEKHAFSSAINLKEVYLPNDKTGKYGVGKISSYAFDNCISLEKIELGYLLNYIESYAFYGCWSLERVDFKYAEVYGIEKSAFENCLSLQYVTFAGIADAINDRAFYGCGSLTQFDLDGVSSLGSYVFQNTGLTEIFIPASVKSTGSAIFFGCESIDVSCEATSRPNGWATDWSTGVNSIKWGVSGEIKDYTLQYYVNGSSIVVTQIRPNQGITEIVLKDTYDGYPISGIDDEAFLFFENVTSIHFPKTVTQISLKAFDDCTSLESISVSANNTSYSSENGILYNADKTVLIKYPKAKKDVSFTAPLSLDVIGEGAFASNISLKKVYLPNDSTCAYGVSIISKNAFENCVSLEEIELGYTTSTISSCSFKDCSSLKRIEIKASTVQAIGQYAFEHCMALRSVKILGTVKSIDDYAFTGCGALAEVNLGKTEKLGSYVFKNSIGLREIVIPISVVSIGSNIFNGINVLTVYCEALSKPASWSNAWANGISNVYWGYEPDNVTKFTFSVNGAQATITGCTGKGEVVIPSIIEGYSVVAIGPNAFTGQTEITQITIPGNVGTIDKTAFDGCTALESLVRDGGDPRYFSTYDGVLFADNGKHIYKYPEGKRDEAYTVPYNVDIIRAYAFKNNPYLKKIILPSDIAGDNYVGKIELGGFMGCTALEEIEGCSVTYFDKEAFRDCTSLKKITFHNNISFIMNQVFLNCTSLESITFKGDVGIINWQSFGYCQNLKNVTFEGKLETLGWGCFEGCSSLVSINIPQGATVIGGEAFKNCVSLQNVTISSTVTKIEKNAFLNTSLKEILIPITVTAIDEFAFEGANDLKIYCAVSQKPTDWNEKWNYTKIDDEERVLSTVWGTESIPAPDNSDFTENADGTLCLNSFTGTGDITVPSEHNGKAVTSIGENAFNGQSEITSIHIPKSITSINQKAFNSLTGLQSITVDTENESFISTDGVLFSKDAKILVRYPIARADKEYAIPNAVERIDSYSFYGCKNIENVTFLRPTPSSYQTIDGIMSNAFENSSIKTFTTNKYIKNIGNYAFYGCASFSEFNNEAIYLRTLGTKAFAGTALKSFYVPFATTTVGGYVFEGCTDLTVDVEFNNPFADWKEWDINWDADVSQINWGVPSDENNSKIAFTIDEDNNVFTLDACSGTGVIEDICHFYDMDLVIDAYAFANLKGVTKIILPYNTVEIHPLAFYNCDVAEFVIQGGLDPEQCQFSVVDGVLYSKDGKTLVKYPSAKADKEFSIPSTVTKIAENAFADAKNLERVFIPSSVLEIPQNAFYNSSVTEIYCEAYQLPSGWSNKWNYFDADTPIIAIWSQVGLPKS